MKYKTYTILLKYRPKEFGDQIRRINMNYGISVLGVNSTFDEMLTVCLDLNGKVENIVIDLIIAVLDNH